jgi:DNA/RNA endonuclease YhcR with UshA esterase domain
MIRARRCVLITALGVFVSTGSVRAHHSFAAEYDAKKPTTLTGTVTKVEWTNPHVRFYIDVKDEAGTITSWEFTMGAVNGLLRRGWTKNMLTPGDTVTVNGYLARDGSHLANARIVTLSDGRKMSGGTAADAPGY